MDAIAVAFEYDCRTQKHIGGEREWKPIAQWMKNLQRIPAIDMGEFVADKFPGQVALLRYINQQMERMLPRARLHGLTNWQNCAVMFHVKHCSG